MDPGVSMPNLGVGDAGEDIELLHRKINDVNIKFRQQQIELHELRCTMRESKAALDNMHDEVRIIRSHLKRIWPTGSSLRGAPDSRGSRRGTGRGSEDGNWDSEHKPTSSKTRRSPRPEGDTFITHDEMVELACTVLRRHAQGMTIAKLGTLMHKEANNHSLPSILKERYGGLKKFLRVHQDIFAIGNDHPYNPHVTIQSSHRTPSYTHHSQTAPNQRERIPAPHASPILGGIRAIGDPIESPSGYARGSTLTTPRNRRSRQKQSRGAMMVPGASGASPSPNAMSPAMRNMQPMIFARSNTWTGLSSQSPRTPLHGSWTEQAAATDHIGTLLLPITPEDKTDITGSTKDEHTRSSLFSSGLSTRLRTNVLKSAYSMHLPPYANGSRMTREISLCFGVVQDDTVRIGRVNSSKHTHCTIVNLYGHVIYDAILQSRGVNKTKLPPEDLSKAITIQECRAHLKNLMSGKIVVCFGIEPYLRELQIAIPSYCLRDIKKRFKKSLPQLIKTKLGLTMGIRNTIEDGRAMMALYWNEREELERASAKEHFQLAPFPPFQNHQGDSQGNSDLEVKTPTVMLDIPFAPQSTPIKTKGSPSVIEEISEEDIKKLKIRRNMQT